MIKVFFLVFVINGVELDYMTDSLNDCNEMSEIIADKVDTVWCEYELVPQW